MRSKVTLTTYLVSNEHVSDRATIRARHETIMPCLECHSVEGFVRFMGISTLIAASSRCVHRTYRISGRVSINEIIGLRSICRRDMTMRFQFRQFKDDRFPRAILILFRVYRAQAVGLAGEDLSFLHERRITNCLRLCNFQHLRTRDCYVIIICLE